MRIKSFQAELLSLLFGLASLSHGDLANFITDLYDGEGIILPPAPGVPEPIALGHVAHFTGEEQIAELNALSSGILAGTGSLP